MNGCKNCRGKLIFDIPEQKLKCVNCGSLFEVEEMDPDIPERKQYEKEIQQLREESVMELTDEDIECFIREKNKQNKNVFVDRYCCEQCGAVICMIDDEAPKECCFCGSRESFRKSEGEITKPDSMIPFKVSREQCAERYRRYIKNQVFVPGAYLPKKAADRFQGMYIPFWSYTVTENGPYRLKGGVTYENARYIVKESLLISGKMDVKINRLYRDASKEFPDRTSVLLGTYDAKDEKRYSPYYLSGFTTVVNDVPAEEYISDVEKVTEDVVLNEWAYRFENQGVMNEQNKNELRYLAAHNPERLPQISGKLTLFPMWFRTNKGRNKTVYHAAVNGQNEDMVADVPISTWKLLLYTLLLAVPLFLILRSAVTVSLPGIASFASLLAMICTLLYTYEIRKGIQRRQQKVDRPEAHWEKQAGRGEQKNRFRQRQEKLESILYDSSLMGSIMATLLMTLSMGIVIGTILVLLAATSLISAKMGTFVHAFSTTIGAAAWIVTIFAILRLRKTYIVSAEYRLKSTVVLVCMINLISLFTNISCWIGMEWTYRLSAVQFLGPVALFGCVLLGLRVVNSYNCRSMTIIDDNRKHSD